MDERRGSWEDLKRQATERLGANAVFGEGPVGATVAIVGEAPGSRRTGPASRSWAEPASF